MRTLALVVVAAAISLSLGGCTVETGSPVSEEDRGELQRGVSSSSGSGTETPPSNTATSSGRALPLLLGRKQAGSDKGPTSEPGPTPWKGDGTSGSPGTGAQKKDGDLHTKIRDMIEPDDGTKP